jgi:hypothetical protein
MDVAPGGGGGSPGIGDMGGEVPSHSGGIKGGDKESVPILAAGGEYVIPPEIVAEIGDGDINHGHEVLDEFVKRVRQEQIKTLRKLPGPAKDSAPPPQ